MNPSYFRIKSAKQDTMERFEKWLELPYEAEPPKAVALSDAVPQACDSNGNWIGPALYFYERNGWTIFEDLAGRFGSISASDWLTFAKNDDFVLAGYNDAIGYGELIVLENGTVVREFLYDSNNPDATVDNGKLNLGVEPLETYRKNSTLLQHFLKQPLKRLLDPNRLSENIFSVFVTVSGE